MTILHSPPPRARFLLSLVLAASLAACGGSDSTTETADSTVPTLAFHSASSTYDLSGYTQTNMIPLTVGSGSDLLNDEASGVTYDTDDGYLYVVGDGATDVVKVNKTTGATEGHMTLSGFADTEDIAYVGSGQFVLMEERLRTATLFTYVDGGTLTKGGAGATSVVLGATVGNVGNEGISYDPKTTTSTAGGFLVVRQSQPTSIYSAGINFSGGTATDLSNSGATIDSSTANPVDLFTGTAYTSAAKTGLSAFNAVFALSNIVTDTTSSEYGDLIISSAPDGKIIKLDRSGNLLSTLYMSASAQNEGVTMGSDGTIYAVGEQAAGAGLPGLTIFKPTTSSSSVGVGSNLYLTFDQDVQAGSGNIIVSNGTDTRTIAVTDTTQVSFSGKVMKVRPTAYLKASSTYNITYAKGVIKTTSGSDTAAVSSATTLAFTTTSDVTDDTTAPTLADTTPANGAAGISSNFFSMDFDEVMQAGTGSITITDGSETRTVPVSDSQVSYHGKRVTVTLSSALTHDATYTVTVPGGALTDLSGNAAAAISQTFTHTTSTAAPTVLISEVNSNTDDGRDFFELYNYGTTDIDLMGWKWGDSHADFYDDNNSAVFTTHQILAAGASLVIVSPATNSAGTSGEDLATAESQFCSNWNNMTCTNVVAMYNVNADPLNPIGLGKGDAVIVYDASGNVVARMNYGTAVYATQGDGTLLLVPLATGVDATLAAAGNHAGAVFTTNALKTHSAVWDGISTSTPNYVAAKTGDTLLTFTETAAAGVAGGSVSNKSMGSPGSVYVAP